MWNIFITAWRAEQSLLENLQAMAQLHQAIPALDVLDSELVAGMYCGNVEQSLLLKRVHGYDYLLHLAKRFEQESILTVDVNTHQAWLRFTDPKVPDLYLGVMRSCDWREVLDKSAWSYNGRQYFLCDPEGEASVQVQDN